MKELRKLWDKHDPNLPWQRGEYNESNTLLLDIAPHKALRNPVSSSSLFSFYFRFTGPLSYGKMEKSISSLYLLYLGHAIIALHF